MSNTAGKLMWVGRATMFFVVLALAVLGYAAKAYAAPGDLDPSFHADGKLTTDFGANAMDAAYDLAVQQNGKIVVVGETNTSSGGGDFALARYNGDGTLDISFGTGGKIITPMAPGTNADAARAITLQPDGKIVVAGHARTSSDWDIAVARYNANGSLDSTFSGDGKAFADLGASHDYANDVTLQGDKIVVGGSTTSYLNNTRTGDDFAVVRFDSTGTLDTTFNNTGMITTELFGNADQAWAVAVTSTKIVVAGSTSYPNNSTAGTDFALARYTDGGSLDATFDTDGKVVTHFGSGSDAAFDLAIQEDGKLVAAGRADNASNDDFAVARYNPDGSLDEEFDFDGKSTTDFGANIDQANSVAIQDDGRIVAAGFSGRIVEFGMQGLDFTLARYNADGTLNNTFHNDGKLKTSFGNKMDTAIALRVQEDGKLVAAGSVADADSSTSENFALARYFGANDVTAPKISVPAQSLVAGTLGLDSTLGASAIPVRIGWSASDSEGELTRIQLQRSVDGGAYANVSVPSATMSGITLQLNPSSTYRFRVRATDDNGNTSFYKYGPSFTVDAHQETSDAITYSTGWTRTSLRGAYGGSVMQASEAGQSATLTFTGRNVAWVTTAGRCECGSATVYLDGKLIDGYELYRPNNIYYKQMMYSANGLDPSVRHTLEVEVSEFANNRIDIDAFVVLR